MSILEQMQRTFFVKKETNVFKAEQDFIKERLGALKEINSKEENRI
jgi:hypothetical protein